MQKRSSNSVKNIYKNRKYILKDLKERAKEIKEQKNVEEVILFGSMARGDYGLYSDADILLILEESGKKRYFDRIPEFIDYFLKAPIDVDLFPYTREEIKRMKDSNPFIKRALAEGIKL